MEDIQLVCDCGGTTFELMVGKGEEGPMVAFICASCDKQMGALGIVEDSYKMVLYAEKEGIKDELRQLN